MNHMVINTNKIVYLLDCTVSHLAMSFHFRLVNIEKVRNKNRDIGASFIFKPYNEFNFTVY